MFVVLLAGCLAADAGDGLVADAADSPERGLGAPLHRGLVEPEALDLRLAIELPPLEPQRSAAALAPSRSGPLRVGLHRRPGEYQGDLLPRLRWVHDAHDGSVTASAVVTVPGAARVRLAVRATLPPGGAIRVFHGLPPEVVGVMDRALFAASGPEVRWSPSVPGSTIGLELTLPSIDARDATVLEIDRVAHGFEQAAVGRGEGAWVWSGQSADASRRELAQDEEKCRRLPLACAESVQWRDVADAVARIRFERPDGSYQCSGTLLNDGDENGFAPYLLTANHCISTQAEAASVEADWFYRHGRCGRGPDPVGRTTRGGAELLATDFELDSSLLVLKGPDWEALDGQGRPVPRFGVRFAGWDSRPRSFGAAFGVHHPGEGPKEYLEGIIEGVEDYVSCNLDGRPCQRRRAGIRVSFTAGAVQGGSGGSGLFRTGRLIGVASSTSDLCTVAHYGNFAEFFPQVRRWLAGRRGQRAQGVGGRGRVLVHGDGLGAATPGEPRILVREGGSGTYSVSVEPRPTRSVKIAVRVSGDADLRASPDVLRFTPENWDAPQEVTLSAGEDDDRDDGSATVAHLVTSFDDAYRESGPVFAVSERDNDLEIAAAADPPVESGEVEVTWEPVAGAVSYVVEWRTENQEFEDCRGRDGCHDAAGRRASRTRVVVGGTTETALSDLEGETLYFVRVTASLDPSYGYLPSSTFSVVTPARQRPFLRGWRLVVPWERGSVGSEGQ